MRRSRILIANSCNYLRQSSTVKATRSSCYKENQYFTSYISKNIKNENRLSHFQLCSRKFSTFNDNPYSILGISSYASDDEIKKAFYKEAKKYHPDLNKKASPEKFKKIAWAYEILSDPTKRAKYDMTGSTSSSGQSMRYSTAEETFNKVFQDLGVSQYFKQVTDDLSTSVHAARHGDYSLLWDFTKERKVLLGSLVLPFVVMARFPGAASVGFRFLIAASVGIMRVIPPHVAFRIFKNMLKR